MIDAYYRRCQLLRAVDGDTLDLTIDLGWRVYSDHRVRLLRVNAPEARGETLTAAKEATAFVWGWLGEHAPHSTSEWPYVIRSDRADAFNRYLVEFLCGGCDASLNSALLETGHAVPYEGRSA